MRVNVKKGNAKTLPMIKEKTKKPKVKSGRIPRIFKLPIGVHEKIKQNAKMCGVSAAEIYDDLIDDFVSERLSATKSLDYLYHKGKVENVSVSLKEEVVYKVKELASRDVTSENRVMFTAVMQFARKTLDVSY